jgi:hypothetical protein
VDEGRIGFVILCSGVDWGASWVFFVYVGHLVRASNVVVFPLLGFCGCLWLGFPFFLLLFFRCS